MKHTIFLCDHHWTIEQIFITSPVFPMKTGANFADFLTDSEELDHPSQPKESGQFILSLHFSDPCLQATGIVASFTDHYLVFLYPAELTGNLNDFLQDYIRHLNWAIDHFTPPYRDEYFQIQQMNNQLINSQRALIKTNQRLQNALLEVRTANDRIALLERDELTGLHTLSAFYHYAQEMLDQNPSTAYDIIILNFQKFKRVNESFGRIAGNLLLKNFSLLLLGLDHTEQGLFARNSSEFYILMPSSLHFYKDLSEEAGSFIRSYPLPLQMHTIIGIYSTEFERLPVETMCDRALLAIDSASSHQENLVLFYQQKLHENLKLEHLILDHIQDALAHQEFLLYLQPKVSIADGHIIGAEALIRWQHPDLGWITPDKFIPLLEKNDLIYEVDKYIWEQACKILSFQKQNSLPVTSISVNAALSDLYKKDLPDVLRNLLKK